MNNQYIRRIIKQNRINLNTNTVKSNSEIIKKKLEKYLVNKKNVAIYMPIQNEVDVTDIINDNKDINFYIPKILKNYQMEFRLIDDKLKNGVYNILESNNVNIIDPKKLDLIIIPLVAFDHNLNRIGQGKGYYDRYLKKVDCIKLGIAFEMQKVDYINKSIYDVPLDLIITENKLYTK